MPRIDQKWRCEVCDTAFDNPTAAETCEKKGGAVRLPNRTFFLGPDGPFFAHQVSLRGHQVRFSGIGWKGALENEWNEYRPGEGQSLVRFFDKTTDVRPLPPRYADWVGLLFSTWEIPVEWVFGEEGCVKVQHWLEGGAPLDPGSPLARAIRDLSMHTVPSTDRPLQELPPGLDLFLVHAGQLGVPMDDLDLGGAPYDALPVLLARWSVRLREQGPRHP